MTLVQAMKLLVLLSVMLTVLSLALRARAGDFLYLFREWHLGLRAVVAMFIVVPAVAIFMADAFDIKGPVKVALVALAFSPVPPLLPRKQAKAGGDASYITGLLVAGALASLVLAPIGLSATGAIYGVETQVSRVGMATTLGLTIAVPLLLGLLGQRVLGGVRAVAVAEPLSKVANVLFAVSVLTLLVALAPAVGKLLGDGTIVALVVMSPVGLATGWFLAGGNRDNQIVLALASAARHPGVAIGIATTSFPDAKLAPAAIILAAVVNTLIAIPFLKRLHKSEA